MPYKSKQQLPDAVKKNLPEHAQAIYMSAYNYAWDEYKKPEDRKGDTSREEVSHKIAWSAVKNKYKKSNGKWVEK